MKKMSVGEKIASSRLNHWVDPSFTDLSAVNSSAFGKKRGCHVLGSKAEVKRPRKRKGETCSADPHTTYLKHSGHHDQDEAWVDRHMACSKAELAVHKKKIEEVENWLRAHTNTSQGGILLLTGPSGCGKTATVQVLCRELGVRIQEWTNPTSLDSYTDIHHDWKMNIFPSSSQSTQFQEFILRANKYNCLKMIDDCSAPDMKLILVEEFPNHFYRQPGSLHDILRCFVKTSRCPLVFIVSDSLSGDSSSRFLFPREILDELDISSISFNPVAPTTMMKVLTRIATLERGKSSGRVPVPEQAVLEMLCAGSSGDIRSAINSLQFSSIPDTSLAKEMLWRDKRLTTQCKAASKPTLRKKSKSTKVKDEEQTVGMKDACLFLFRALGKILHCKRGRSDGAESSCVLDLPAHLCQHHRESLQVDPEFVVERSHMSGEFFNLYLHQNYLDFFSEIEDVDRASEYLSDADLLTSDWTSRSVLGEYASSVATRGLLHSNSQQVSVGFRPLHKPHWLLITKKHRDNCLVAQCLFRSFCMTPVSLQTQLLPYLAKLTNPLRNQGQIAFIQDVGHMSLKRFPGRLKLEALADKEPGQLDMDDDDDDKEVEFLQDRSEEGLPASQPQPPTSILEEEDDDDVSIEEYSSDEYSQHLP
ncbi:cell cycle checkpoint protein RAD17 isoform X2 [Dunckerocampus dactyliophorus]|uniref:cell cycle checkpoint protein RAD17 isoform X2 n=1 Tax=Dunckerocampus dactyliophorus TaxID=161453 RepID=UPI002406E479|nr:cell cycle checkpoint protein RAD17 isoform X2 [Dunckerocampus dactyliophorus]